MAEHTKLPPSDQQQLQPIGMGMNEQLTAAKAQLGLSAPEARAAALSQFQGAAFSALQGLDAQWQAGAQTGETYKGYFFLMDVLDMCTLLAGGSWSADPRCGAEVKRCKAAAFALGKAAREGALASVPFVPPSGGAAGSGACTPPPPSTRTHAHTAHKQSR